MSWADKAHKKHQIHKLVEQAMNSKEISRCRKRKTATSGIAGVL